MDFKLSDEQREFQKLARDFAEREIAPIAHKYEQSGEYPRNVHQKAWESGLLNVQIPDQLAGLGLSLWDTSLIAEGLATGCSGIASAFEFTTIAQMPLIMVGDSAQQKQYLAPLADSLVFGGIDLDSVFADRGAGLKVSQRGSEYVLNGVCKRLLNATIAEWYVVAADDESTNEKRYFVVPKTTSGVSVAAKVQDIGRKLADVHAVNMLNVVLLPSAELKAPNREVWQSQLRLHIQVLCAAGMIGVAQAALDHSVRYANERKTFGKAIAEHQAVGFMMADMAKDIEAARLMTWQAAVLADKTETPGKKALAAYIFASDMMIKACIDAVQVFGGYGYSKEYPVEKLMRDAKTYQTLCKTNHLFKLELGSNLLLV
jgi:acyl-CoA dehydrogenase